MSSRSGLCFTFWALFDGLNLLLLLVGKIRHQNL
jgi:hypothetical protein